VAVAVALSALVLADERAVAGSQARIDRQTRGNDSDILLEEMLRTGATLGRQPPRATLTDALMIALWAQARPDDPRRTTLLAQANDLATRAARSRPYWGEAWAVTAFARSLKGAAAGADADMALAASYRATPYLRHAAAWRVRYGLGAFERLDASTRARVVDEAVWIARIDPATLDAIVGASRGSDAYFPFLLRWRAMREDDADWQARGRLAP
jgi:hypothetical protein